VNTSEKSESDKKKLSCFAMLIKFFCRLHKKMRTLLPFSASKRTVYTLAEKQNDTRNNALY